MMECTQTLDFEPRGSGKWLPDFTPFA
jgi:hypothetical protein